MSISLNAVGSGGSDSFDPSKMASTMASKMMRDLDPGNTGKVTKDQFVSALKAKGVSSADATTMYDSIDTQGTGSITKSDIETAIKNGNLKPPSGGPQGGPGGAGGAGKPGGAGAPGGAGKSSAGGSSQTYDAADTNQDGVVSAEEAAIYAVKHSAKHASTSTTESTKTDLSKLGKNVDTLA